MNACDIVAEALGIDDPVERQSYVDKTCGDNQTLVNRVNSMLEFHGANHSFLDDTTFQHALLADRLGESVGTTIDNYKLLELIGEGGFGTVYLAEQTEPVARKVALKIIKLGMDTRQVVARFEAERQALAMMDHPNIARVFDAGATEGGRPYFVMELVNGVSITEFCDENRMPIRQRLELFTEVCHAVQHAHQKGIIHRDIKPSNILVSLKAGVPVPKVIDFGVAKAIDKRLTERTLFTHFGQMVGTPQYMSPEQAQMSVLTVDTRSDIYSLGVLLFELLTGSPPLGSERLRSAGLDEMQRIIAEEDPPTPSAKISESRAQSPSIADFRSVEHDMLYRLARGDLDWISMKCLSKDPDHRYSSASALAADVNRHLTDEPVVAGPPSRIYRCRKFLKRNRSIAWGTLATVAALSIGLVFAVMAFVQTNQARRSAETSMALLRGFVTQIDPESGKGPHYSALKMVDDFAQGIPDLPNDPDVEVQLRLFLGDIYSKLGQNEKAFGHLQKAVSLQEDAKLDLQAAKTLCDIADGSSDAGRFPRNVIRAMKCAEQAIVICEAHNDSSETMVRAHAKKAFTQIQLSQTDAAEATLDNALRILRSAGKEADVTKMPSSFAWLKLARGKPQEALDLLLDAADQQTDKNKDEHPDSFLQAYCLSALGRHAEAEVIYRAILNSTPRATGTYSFRERRMIKGIADGMRATNRLVEAAEWLDGKLEAMTDTTLAWLLPDWTIAQLDLGRYELVADYCEATAERMPSTGEELNTKVLAQCLREIVSDAVGSSPDLAKLAALGKPDALNALQAWPDDFGMQLIYAWNESNHSEVTVEELLQAEKQASRAVAVMRKASPVIDGRGFRSAFPFHGLARVKAKQGDFASAVAIEKQAIAKLTPDHWFLRGYFEACLADYLVNAGQTPDAEQLLLAACAEKDEAKPRAELRFHIANARLKLAEVRLGQTDVKKREQAKADIEIAKRILQESPNENSLKWAARLTASLDE